MRFTLLSLQRLLPFLTLAFAVITVLASAANAERRVALVVGNSNYDNATALANPANDARAMSETLKKAGFSVNVSLDAGKEQLESAVRTFLGELDNADIGLFFYAGHAVQVNGSNYIIPIDAKLDKAIDLDFESINIDRLQSYMEKLASVRLIFLDSCRNNPFQGRQFSTAIAGSRSVAGDGLAVMQASSGTLIAYSTAPGTVASDGTSSNSPFTKAFIAHALSPGIEIRKLLTTVRNEVSELTNGEQVPWENSALFDDFYFVPPREAPIVAELHEVRVPAGADPVPMHIPIPRQPAGGELRIVLESLPENGITYTAGKQARQGDEIGPEMLAALRFSPSSGQRGKSGLLKYRVKDEWGHDEAGLVAVLVDPQRSATGADVAPELDAPPAGFPAAWQTLPEIDVALGTEPVLLLPKDTPADALRSATVEIEATPQQGQVLVGDRVLQAGENIIGSELHELAFRSSAEVDSDRDLVRLALAGSGGRLDLYLRLKTDPCDTEAGEPLDLQGVAKGRIPNEIDIDRAYEACIKAVVRHPNVGRFFYQLARVTLAKGDIPKTEQLLGVAIEKDHIRAQQLYGILLLRGAFGKQDNEGALLAFEAGAAKGDPYAMYSLGKRLFRGDAGHEDVKRGLELMLKAAEMGHTFAMNELADIFANGRKVPIDTERAMAFHKISVERNDPYGFNNLGLAYARGQGVDVDYKKAMELFLKAVDGGHPFAATNIGRLYYNGLGVQKDIGKAVEWYDVSVKRGDPWAANNIAYIASHGEAGAIDMGIAAKYRALAVAYDQTEPSAAALAELEKMPEKELLAGVGLIVGEKFGGFDGTRENPFGSRRDQVMAAMDEYRIDRPGRNLLDCLLAAGRLAWLSSNPRFDYF